MICLKAELSGEINKTNKKAVAGKNFTEKILSVAAFFILQEGVLHFSMIKSLPAGFFFIFNYYKKILALYVKKC